MERYQKKSVALATGETYAYIEQGHGDKVYLLIHGNMSSSVFFHTLLERLPKDIHVFAPDLRGFGDSTYNHRFDSLSELADDLLAFCDALGIKEAYVLGWSTGAIPAYKLAVKRPSLVKKIISLDGASVFGYPIFKKDEKYAPILGQIYKSKEELATDPVQVAPALGATALQNRQFYDYVYSVSIFHVKKPEPELMEYFIDEILKQRNLVDIDWGLATINMSDKPSLYTVKGDNDIHLVKCPVLLLWGDADRVVMKYMVEETFEALPNATMKVYKGASHAPITDIPDQFAKDVLKFFN